MPSNKPPPPVKTGSSTTVDSSSSELSAKSALSSPVSPRKSTSEDKVSQEVTENMDLQDNSAVGKVRAMLGMLSKFIGVKDILNLRISLPASFLDPISNLEFWNYMDRPDFFVTIADSDDPLDRMLNVIKWWYSKDTKWLANKVAKPYNSILGEQFLCKWKIPFSGPLNTSLPLDSSGGANRSIAVLQPYGRVESTGEGVSSTNVYCITEQISHHPPVSAFVYYCKDKGIMARGVDHLGAKFTGTSVKIYPGSMNRGIFVNLEGRDNEEYQLTHPCGIISGWLKASLAVAVGEECVISCPRTGMRAILEYKEEPYFGKAKYAVSGKVFLYDPANEAENSIRKLSKVPDDKLLCIIGGCWRGQITYKKVTPSAVAKAALKRSTVSVAASVMSDASFKTANTAYSVGSAISYQATDSPNILVDLTDSTPIEKILPPIEEQAPCESRKIWKEVTENIISGNISDATRIKRTIEDNQRDTERERKEKGEVYRSQWFGFRDPDGVMASFCEEDELMMYEGETQLAEFIPGKPFLLKSMASKLPWNIAETPTK